jgi:ABC-type amino acid transport substrate-binding protein
MIKNCSLILIACLLVISCSKRNEKITDISQLKDKRICVLTGSAGDVAAKKLFPRRSLWI